MTTSAAPVAPTLKKTALNATHRALKAKMVDFGGWDMPVEYPGAGCGFALRGDAGYDETAAVQAEGRVFAVLDGLR